MDTRKFQTWTNYTSIHYVIDISAIANTRSNGRAGLPAGFIKKEKRRDFNCDVSEERVK